MPGSDTLLTSWEARVLLLAGSFLWLLEEGLNWRWLSSTPRARWAGRTSAWVTWWSSLTTPHLASQSFILSATLHLGGKNIATTQFSPELNSLDWGGFIIDKINHTTTTLPPPLDDFFDLHRQVWNNAVWYRVERDAVWHRMALFGLA